MRSVIAVMILLIVTGISARVIDLEEARQIALQNNQQYLAAQDAYQSSKWNRIGALTNFLPSANLVGSQTSRTPAMNQIYDEDHTRSFGVNLTQPIFTGGNIYHGYNIARSVQKIAELNQNNQRLETISKVEEKYFTVLEMQELFEIAQNQLKLAQDNLQIAKVQYEQDIISRADYLQFQADKANKESELIQSQTMYNLSSRDLKNFLQIDEDVDPEPIEFEAYEDIISHLTEKNADDLLLKATEIGLKQNLPLQIVQMQTAIADKTVAMKYGNFLPKINLSYTQSYNKQWNETISASDVDYQDSKQLGISLSIPLFPLADSYAELSEAKYDRKVKQREEKSAKDNIELGLEQALLNIISSAKQVQASQISLSYTEEMYTEMEERFRNGLITATDLLNAELMLKSARMNRAKNFFNLMKAESKLMQQMGLETRDEFYQILSLK